MDAICVCEGPLHVIIECNDALITTGGIDPRGLPAREAYCGFEDLQRLMDVCYRTGEEQVVYMDDGATWLTFRWEDEHASGVATAYRPHPVSANLPSSVAPSVAA